MDIALYMSRVIHNDLTIAGVTSWSYWTSMDISQWGQKDRFLLISLVPNGWTGDGGDTGLLRNGGSYEAMPTLWVLGNYSRFLRLGMDFSGKRQNRCRIYQLFEQRHPPERNPSKLERRSVFDYDLHDYARQRLRRKIIRTE